MIKTLNNVNVELHLPAHFQLPSAIIKMSVYNVFIQQIAIQKSAFKIHVLNAKLILIALEIQINVVLIQNATVEAVQLFAQTALLIV